MCKAREVPEVPAGNLLFFGEGDLEAPREGGDCAKETIN